MLRKVIWIILAVTIAILARAGLEHAAGSLLRAASARIEIGDYDGARRALDRIDRWYSWTDAGDRTGELREAIEVKIAEDSRREEAERQRREMAELEAESRASGRRQSAPSGSGGDRRSDGVYHGLNRAEELKKLK